MARDAPWVANISRRPDRCVRELAGCPTPAGRREELTIGACWPSKDIDGDADRSCCKSSLTKMTSCRDIKGLGSWSLGA